jgi:hypothetical protein
VISVFKGTIPGQGKTKYLKGVAKEIRISLLTLQKALDEKDTQKGKQALRNWYNSEILG